MKEWLYRSYGDEQVLVEEEAPSKVCGPNQIRVDTKALSINPIDWKLMSGKMRFIIPVKFPNVPCFDVAGIVTESGAASGFQVGERILVRLDEKTGGAAAAEVVVNAAVAAPMPTSMSFVDAAALPLAGMTALQGLRDHGGLPMQSAHKRVLVVGASGGVGHFAVQIALAMGADVTAVCGPDNLEWVRALGPQTVIDYRQAASLLPVGAAPYDVVLDCVGESPLRFAERFAPVLKPDGIYVTPAPTGGSMLRALMPWRRPKTKNFFLKTNRPDLEVLTSLWVEKKLQVHVDRTFPFAALPLAMKHSMSGRTAGKVVVTTENAG